MSKRNAIFIPPTLDDDDVIAISDVTIFDADICR